VNSKLFRLALTSAVAAAIAASACNPSSDDGASGSADVTASSGLFDVNDVSILFPLGDDGLPRPNITLDDMAGSAKLVDDGAFDTLTKFAQTGTKGTEDSDDNKEVLGALPHIGFRDGVLDRKNWRIVGMRFDPCAPGGNLLGFDDPKCLLNVRLIAQPFIDGRDQDVTAHLVYNLGLLATNRSVLTDAVKKLAAIKAKSQTTGKPLGVHPGLAADSDGSIGALVKDFILSFAGQAKDTGFPVKLASARTIAFMAKDGDFTRPADAPEWYFFFGDVGGHGADAAWKAKDLPAVARPDGSAAKFVKLSFKQRQEGEGDFTPTAQDGTSAAVAGHILPAPSGGTSPLFAGVKDPESLVQKIENPDKSTVLNTDCTACHTTTSRSVALNLGPQARLAVPPGITGVVRRDNLQASVANVRNFGYFLSKPSISMRTLNETVAIVSFIDKKVLNGAAGPASVNVDDHLWACCMTAGADPSCGNTVCASPAPQTRRAVLEPNGGGGDPCTPEKGDEIDPRNGFEVEGTNATIHGNPAACLTLSMNGNFFSNALDVACPQLDLCKISLKGGAQLPADVSRRLQAVLFRPENGTGYVLTDGAKKISMGCESSDSCHIDLTSAAGH
jgi:hypothetical protein